MARAALNWSIKDLAQAAGVHWNTISNFETGKFAGTAEAVGAVREAFEAAGVTFLSEKGKGPGVRWRNVVAPSLDDRIAEAERVVERPIPVEASPEKGMAMLRRGRAELQLKGFKGKKGGSVKPARKP